jgi:hypothetical protein
MPMRQQHTSMMHGETRSRKRDAIPWKSGSKTTKCFIQPHPPNDPPILMLPHCGLIWHSTVQACSTICLCITVVRTDTGVGAASARRPLFRALRWGPRLALKEKPTKPNQTKGHRKVRISPPATFWLHESKILEDTAFKFRLSRISKSSTEGVRGGRWSKRRCPLPRKT